MHLSQSEVDIPVAYYSVKYIINAYMWNLEKWYQWTYLQGRNRDADMEKKLVDRVGEGEVGQMRE